MLCKEAKAEFERCWPWILASLEYAAFKYNGKIWFTHEKHHVWERIVTGKAYFWPGKECFVLTEFYVSPTGLKSHHTWLAGGNLKEIKK